MAQTQTLHLNRDDFIRQAKILAAQGLNTSQIAAKLLTNPLDPTFEAELLYMGAREYVNDITLTTPNRNIRRRLARYMTSRTPAKISKIPFRSVVRDMIVATSGGQKKLENCTIAEAEEAIRHNDQVIAGLVNENEMLKKIVKAAKKHRVATLGQLSDQVLESCI